MDAHLLAGWNYFCIGGLPREQGTQFHNVNGAAIGFSFVFAARGLVTFTVRAPCLWTGRDVSASSDLSGSAFA